MSKERIRLGRQGEDIAVDFLRKKGYNIVDRNFRCKMGEVDIVAREDEKYCFVEVKTRTSEDFGSPNEAVVWKKEKRIIRTAQFYLKMKRLLDVSVRFDIIAIMVGKEGVKGIELFKDAFWEKW